MILEFLGGAAFRAITGQLMSVWTKWQDHRHEKEMLALQMQMEDRAAERQAAALRLSAELQVKTVEIQRDAAVATEEASAFRTAVAAAMNPTGINWVDAWNGAVRPAFATLAFVLILFYFHSVGWKLDDKGWDLVGVIVGFFFADRQFRKSGK